MKRFKRKLVIEIIGIILALVVGGGILAEVNDDDDDFDDDCFQSCQVESDDVKDDDD